MNSIEINIYQKGKKVSKTFSGPSSWDEITTKQLLEICKTVNKNQTAIHAEILIALKLFGIPRNMFNLIGSENRYAILTLIKFIEEDRVFDKNLLPSFWHRCRKFYGPNDEYDNIQGIEFAYAEDLYIKYKSTKEVEYLNELTALLYRPRRYFDIKDDIRQDFYTISAGKRAKLFKSLPFEYKFAVYLNYEGWRNWLINRYDVIFPVPKDLDQNEDEENESKPYDTSLWTTSYRMIAESGVFGDYDKVCRQSILVLFTQLSDKILESQRQKEELDKLRT